MEIFERASRAKIRYPSSAGDLTTEQLWDLPLSHMRSTGVDLDKIARQVNGELKSIAEGSFVSLTPDPRQTELELKLDVLKHVIASKLAARTAAETAMANAERKRVLLSVLAAKEESQLAGMSREEIKAEIAKLDA